MAKKVKKNRRNILYDPFQCMSFSYRNCFLCGAPIRSKKNYEHVIPKWLQGKFGLWNKRITLLNGSQITYKKLTVPCCYKCNNTHLSKLERTIERAHDIGYSKFSKLPNLTIYQWAAKIFYGLLFKELSLLNNRRNKNEGFITSPQLLERFQMLHAFLQSTRLPFNFEGFTPGSIFVVETHEYLDERNFDYYDCFYTLVFSIRMGQVGVIAQLGDNGAQQILYEDFFKKFHGIKLHPIQYNEVVAQVSYQSTLFNRTPKYVTIMPHRRNGRIKVIPLPLAGFSTRPIFDDRNPEEYAHVLALFLRQYGLTFKDVFEKPNKTRTFLLNEDGSVNILEKDALDS